MTLILCLQTGVDDASAILPSGPSTCARAITCGCLSAGLKLFRDDLVVQVITIRDTVIPCKMMRNKLCSDFRLGVNWQIALQQMCTMRAWTPSPTTILTSTARTTLTQTAQTPTTVPTETAWKSTLDDSLDTVDYPNNDHSQTPTLDDSSHGPLQHQPSMTVQSNTVDYPYKNARRHRPSMTALTRAASTPNPG
jgi:hypothetical protein